MKTEAVMLGDGMGISEVQRDYLALIAIGISQAEALALCKRKEITLKVWRSHSREFKEGELFLKQNRNVLKKGALGRLKELILAGMIKQALLINDGYDNLSDRDKTRILKTAELVMKFQLDAVQDESYEEKMRRLRKVLEDAV
uniref:Uncharacterized protein n=1 Tax=viral metagenome TaxID=1070528 RepID=A0A6M3Y0R5_9ZZZZ